MTMKTENKLLADDIIQTLSNDKNTAEAFCQIIYSATKSGHHEIAYTRELVTEIMEKTGFRLNHFLKKLDRLEKKDD